MANVAFESDCLPPRFWEKISVSADGCWNWTASLDDCGYGKYAIGGGRWRRAHRISFGDVPEGLELDHLCRNRACCNPSHLEAVTHRTNMSRADWSNNFNRKKTHCKGGHEFSATNTYIDKHGFRHCRKCRALRARKRRGNL